MPQDRSVVKDDIDAYELLQRGKTDADPHELTDSVRGRIDQVTHARPVVVGGQRMIDFLDLAFRRLPSYELRQHLEGLVSVSAQDQVTGTLRDHQQGNEEDRRRQDLDPEHPAPRLESQPEFAGRPAGSAGEQIVADEGDEQARNDRDLLHRCQRAAVPGRRDFRYVCRGQDARGADGEAAQYPIDDEFGGRECDAGTPGTDDKEHGGDAHDPASPEAVCKASGKECPHRTAEQHRRNVEPGAYAVGVERPL